METIGHYKGFACRKRWCNERTKTKMVKVRKIWKKRYRKEDWYPVRFSDECHYGIGPQETLRKPGERYCQDCIPERDPKADGTKKS